MNDPKGEYQSDTMHVSNRRMEVVEDDEWYDAYAILYHPQEKVKSSVKLQIFLHNSEK